MRRIMPPLSERARQKRRLLRQFAVMERRIPGLRRPLRLLLRDGGGMVRMPFAVLLMAGGLFSFLPFLGVWMLPLGLVLLSLDFVLLRRPTARMMVLGERLWLRFRRGRRAAG